MNKRIRKKHLIQVKPAAKPTLQEAWDVVAEHLAANNSVCAFVEIAWGPGHTGECYKLYDNAGMNVVSKPVRHWRG